MVEPARRDRTEALERWLQALVATPGLTAVKDIDAARRLHIDEALRAADLLEAGSLVDVGSGGGSPGFPLAAARPDLGVTLLEATRKKATFLERWAAEFENVVVRRDRAETFAETDGREAFDSAVARALAPPAVALEWVLPLVRHGGRLVLYTTLSERDLVAGVAPLVGGRLLEVTRAGGDEFALCVVGKVGDTPPGFPRRPGVARKRPLRSPADV